MATARERVHLLRSIVVTAPIFHLDTSELLKAVALRNTAKRECHRESKTNPPQTATKKSNVKNKNNKTCENDDPMKLAFS